MHKYTRTCMQNKPLIVYSTYTSVCARCPPPSTCLALAVRHAHSAYVRHHDPIQKNTKHRSTTLLDQFSSIARTCLRCADAEALRSTFWQKDSRISISVSLWQNRQASRCLSLIVSSSSFMRSAASPVCGAFLWLTSKLARQRGECSRPFSLSTTPRFLFQAQSDMWAVSLVEASEECAACAAFALCRRWWARSHWVVVVRTVKVRVKC